MNKKEEKGAEEGKEEEKEEEDEAKSRRKKRRRMMRKKEVWRERKMEINPPIVDKSTSCKCRTPGSTYKWHIRDRCPPCRCQREIEMIPIDILMGSI
ncbi:hypothetical protein M8J77_004641 [Diaphorina citri]|nr:hypothetical protein M8J77_004641 [Diaphorina citri]